VSRRLRAALDDLISIAPPDRVAVLRDQATRLGSLVDLTVQDGHDAAEALVPDAQGLGVKAGSR
jgi:hypothetical protein